MVRNRNIAPDEEWEKASDDREDQAVYKERQFSPEETEFMLAVDRYKRKYHRPFPAWSEVLSVLVSLGYRKVADPGPLPVFRSRKRGEF